MGILGQNTINDKKWGYMGGGAVAYKYICSSPLNPCPPIYFFFFPCGIIYIYIFFNLFF